MSIRKITPWTPVALLGVFLLVGALSAPAEAQPSTSGHAQFKIAVDCTSTASSTSFGFTPTVVWFKNDLNSANEVYFLWGLSATDVTTTTGTRLEPGDGVAMSGTPAQWLGLRCVTTAAETATIYGQAVR